MVMKTVQIECLKVKLRMQSSGLRQKDEFVCALEFLLADEKVCYLIRSAAICCKVAIYVIVLNIVFEVMAFSLQKNSKMDFFLNPTFRTNVL